MMKKIMLMMMLFCMSYCLFATNQQDIVHRMPNLVLQLGIIIIIARLCAILAEKLKVPGVLGELLAGIIIGPYLLGSIPILGFPHGLFAIADVNFPIQPELYGIAIVASIILLFLSGLETDIEMFIKFSFAGLIIGISGIIFSFALGALTAIYFLHIPFMDPKCLFLGVMSTATSVGITARILSERKKTDSPEGVTILAGAVIDDVFGVILLAIVMGISTLLQTNSLNSISWTSIGLLTIKEISIWLGVTGVGLFFAHQIAGVLKRFKNHIVLSVIAISLALIVAGLFEKAGLAMIIGAYVVGLVLSKTELRFTIQEALQSLKIFLVPVFFVVMGMLVDVTALFSYKTIIFSLVYTTGAILSKYIGCSLPALGLNFNWLGARRIGLGMIPRGEVALIIAGIGLSYGFLKDPVYDLFSIAIMMTLLTTLIAPPLFNLSLKNDKSGVRNTVNIVERVNTELYFEDHDLNEMLCHKLLINFRNLGFFINKADSEEYNFQIRKDLTNLVLEKHKHRIVLNSSKEALHLVKSIINISLSELKANLTNINLLDEQLNLKSSPINQNSLIIDQLLNKEHICLLKSDNKEDAIWELLNLFNETELSNVKELYLQLLNNDNLLNSGLYNGLAIPNICSVNVKNAVLAIGISSDGILFGSGDKKPSKLIILHLSPAQDTDNHIAFLSQMIKLANQSEYIEELVKLNQIDVIYVRLKEIVL